MVTISSSVIRRDSRSRPAVMKELKNNGWSRTGSALGGRLIYMENSGFSLTVVDGPAGTLVVPSGPIRGRVFGDSGLNLGLMDGGLTGFNVPGPITPFGGRDEGPTEAEREAQQAQDREDALAEENPEQPSRKTGQSDFV